MSTARRWIRTPLFDTAFILAPPFVAVAAVLAFVPRAESGAAGISGLAWLLLILCVDVGHVYSTLYRTYLSPRERERRAGLLWLVPLGCWLAGVVLYSQGARAFWTVLAYLAAFHFVRQQYGFLRIYTRGGRARPEWERWLDGAAIYLAALYPLAHWHARLPRNFSWFIEGDFRALPPGPLAEGLVSALGVASVVALTAFAVKELGRRARANWPALALVFGTAAAWYVGIVHYNDDLAFTVTNVLPHGIPYVALIWAYGNRRREGRVFKPHWLPVFLGLLVALAFVEEGLWDSFVWRDHARLFWSGRNGLPRLTDAATLTWLVPLLALPQATHYVLDGFIWKKEDLAGVL